MFLYIFFCIGVGHWVWILQNYSESFESDHLELLGQKNHTILIINKFKYCSYLSYPHSF